MDDLERTRSRRLWPALLALAIGLSQPYIALAWKCREGFETSEACVWGKAYLPLSRWIGLLLVTPITFGLLVGITLAWTLWRKRPGE